MNRTRSLARCFLLSAGVLVSASAFAGQPLFLGEAQPDAAGQGTANRLAAKRDTAALRVVRANPAVVSAGTSEIEVDLGGRRVNLVLENARNEAGGSLVWTGHVRETAQGARHDRARSAPRRQQLRDPGAPRRRHHRQRAHERQAVSASARCRGQARRGRGQRGADAGRPPGRRYRDLPQRAHGGRTRPHPRQRPRQPGRRPGDRSGPDRDHPRAWWWPPTTRSPPTAATCRRWSTWRWPSPTRATSTPTSASTWCWPATRPPPTPPPA